MSKIKPIGKDRLSIDQIAHLIAYDCGLPIKDCKKFYQSYLRVLYDMVLEGYVIQFPMVGKICYHFVKATKPSMKTQFKGKGAGEIPEYTLVDGTPAHYRPKFEFVDPIKETIKRNTLGAVKDGDE